MDPVRARALLAKRLANQITPDRPLTLAFDKQREFITDPHRHKALWCTRRSAKSYTAGLYLVHDALKYPKSNCLFIGLTRQSALDIVWKDILKEINLKLGLKAKFNESRLTMTLTNGSVITITGADSSDDEMNKLLGRKYRLVCIDEGSTYTIDTRKLVYGILGPAMADLQGTICMLGTSSNFTRGLFYDITTGKERGWKCFQWTAFDNPHMASQWAKDLAEIDELRPEFKETPLYKQWYLNQWVIDTDKLVYKFNEYKNLYSDLPKSLSPTGWTYVLGVDTGWEDDNAFVLVAFHDNDPILRVVKTFNKKHMTFDQVVNKINDFMEDPAHCPVKVVIDGANKQGVESMRHRSNIPFEYADKRDKATFIELLNGDMAQGKVKVSRGCTELINEMMGLVWKTEPGSDRILVPKKEHPSLPNHLCDAFLYAWRNGYHYQFTEAVETIPMYSKKWYDKQAENMWERERERLTQGQQGEWPAEAFDSDPVDTLLSRYGIKKPE